jgi:Polyketide cyclase / dehydrase and lipid transport
MLYMFLLYGKIKMWQQSKSRIIKGTKEAVWALWSNIDNWPKWDPDVDYVNINGHFAVGDTITFKIKKGPKVKMKLVEVVKDFKYTDLTSFPLAKMYGVHQMEEVPGGLKLTTTIIIKGPLRWLWRKIVGETVVKEIPIQFDNIERLVNDQKRVYC